MSNPAKKWISMTISPSITPANCFDRRSDAAVPYQCNSYQADRQQEMISLKL